MIKKFKTGEGSFTSIFIAEGDKTTTLFEDNVAEGILFFGYMCWTNVAQRVLDVNVLTNSEYGLHARLSSSVEAAEVNWCAKFVFLQRRCTQGGRLSGPFAPQVHHSLTMLKSRSTRSLRTCWALHLLWKVYAWDKRLRLIYNDSSANDNNVIGDFAGEEVTVHLALYRSSLIVWAPTQEPVTKHVEFLTTLMNCMDMKLHLTLRSWDSFPVPSARMEL